jgi:hypothetical protein
MCELLVGLPKVVVLGIDDVAHGSLRVHIETLGERAGCTGCGVFARVKDGRWVTEQVGRHARTVNEVAVELGCDWHSDQ